MCIRPNREGGSKGGGGGTNFPGGVPSGGQSLLCKALDGLALAYPSHTSTTWSEHVQPPLCPLLTEDVACKVLHTCTCALSTQNSWRLSCLVHSISFRVRPSLDSSGSGCPKSTSLVRASRSDIGVTVGKVVTVLCKTDEDLWTGSDSGEDMV